MADEADPIEIEIEDKAPELADADIVVTKAEDEPKGESIEDALAALKQQLAEKDARIIDAERRAHDATQTVGMAQNDIQDSNLQVVVGAIDQINQAQDFLKTSYKEAMAAGDFDTATECNTAMLANAARLITLEQGKTALENQPKREPAPFIPSDPVEALASQLSPRSAQWVRNHPEYAQDQRLYTKMLAAHNLALADGVQADSDAYFEAIEGTLKINNGTRQELDASADAAQVTQRRTAPPAAPVSRGGGGTGSANSNIVRLSAEEREMAANMGMTDKEYALNKRELQKAGRLH